MTRVAKPGEPSTGQLGGMLARDRRLPAQHVVCVMLGMIAALVGDPDLAAQVRAVPRVAMDGMEPAVRQQIAAQRDRLEQLAQENGAAGPALGQAYGELGQLYLLYDLAEPAAAALTNATNLDPDQPRWPYLLGSLHELEGRRAPARQSYREALTRAGTGTAALPIVARLVRSLLLEGPAAAEELQELSELIARLEQPDAEAYRAFAAFARGEAAFAREQHEQAAEWFARALAAQPEANQLHYRLALAHRQSGDLDRARFHLENRGDREITFPDPVVADLRSQARGAGAQLMLGRIALSTDDLDEAERRFRAALEIDPASSAALQSLGNLHRRRGDLDRALEAYERAISSSPDDVRLRIFVARLLLRRAQEEASRSPDPVSSTVLSDRQRALGHLEEAALLAPDQIAIQVEWAEALQSDARHEEADRAYVQALARAPSEFDLHYLRAQNASRHIADLGTRNLLTAAELERIGSRGREALSAFRAGLEASGKTLAPSVEVELGLLELRLGDNDPGRQRLRRVLENSDQPTADRARAAFHLGNEAAQRSALDEAAIYLQRAIDLEPDLREARINLARLQEGRGALDEAAANFRSLLASDPQDLAARFALAQNRLRAGRYGDAKKLLLEGLELAPGTPAFAQLLVRIVAAAPDRAVRDGALGLDLAQRLFEALPTTDHAESVAMALAELGRYEDAVTWQTRVVEELQSQGRSTEVAAERLEAYRSQRPIWGWGPASTATDAGSSPPG